MAPLMVDVALFRKDLCPTTIDIDLRSTALINFAELRVDHLVDDGGKGERALRKVDVAQGVGSVALCDINIADHLAVALVELKE